ncbi:MAG TPA: hypothetical protein VGD53_00675 [Actinoallomurus sp.]
MDAGSPPAPAPYGGWTPATLSRAAELARLPREELDTAARS